MKRHEAFPSKYLSKEEVETPITATIASVKMETFSGDNGDESKPALYFLENIKPCLLNNANWMTCEDLYGPESDDWAGKKIEVYKDPNVMFGKKRVGGVRLRQPLNGNGAHPRAELSPIDTWVNTPTSATWKAFCASVGASSDLVNSIFGEAGVSSWMRAKPENTAKNAAQLVLDALANEQF